MPAINVFEGGHADTWKQHKSVTQKSHKKANSFVNIEESTTKGSSDDPSELAEMRRQFSEQKHTIKQLKLVNQRQQEIIKTKDEVIYEYERKIYQLELGMKKAKDETQ